MKDEARAGEVKPYSGLRPPGSISEVFNEDCMIGMARYPDKFFDLAVVDPPYGILSKAGCRLNKYGVKHKKWDAAQPDYEYFEELFRVSKNQIIWGGNYFPPLWSEPCKCFIFWHKHQPLDNWSSGELAWTSFNCPAKCFDYMYYGSVNKERDRFHPTQKPIALYAWLLDKFAGGGYRILDTHMGSQSSRIAAHRAGLDYYGWELDAEYFAAGCKRYKEQMMQLTLF